MLALVALASASCKKLLEEIPEYELVGENAIVDQSTALNALNGTYAFLKYEPLASGTYTYAFSFEFAVNAAQMAGLLGGGRRSTFDESLRYHSVVPSDNNLPAFYRQAYRIVNAANNVIHYTQLIPASKINDPVRKQILAEAHFLRGFGHLWLLKYYGYHWDVSSEYGIVVRKEPTNLGNLITGRSNVADSYQAIIQDFEHCIENTAGPSASVFQVSNSTAKAYLAEVLTMRQAPEDLSRIITLADEIIAAGDYKLETTFAEVFNPSNDYKQGRELMFSRALNQEALADILTSTGFFSYRVFHNAVGSGGVVYYPSDNTGDHYITLLEQDERYVHTWDSVTVTIGNPPEMKHNLSFVKVWRANANCPSYLMRLAQVYLMKAEAMLNTNAPVKDVLAILNIFRERSGNVLYVESQFAGVDGRHTLREALVNEYVLELGVENASEFLAMVRNKDQGGSRMIGRFNIHFSTDASLALPIPHDEVVLNKGAVIQNPLVLE
ncbi:RagB/SusD family nutrient uptake outer membrane protein [Sphingobacterium sp. C459-1T]|uniref:RagB/SusD family nutrient uptake outer membrane protein n=1 Tax=Sphingobacterium faecale TaxID=2803775 RepID=A0ABS1R9Q6_9SPHI|nr:RagB/SusD family nutrient uptake outer membrane protein [Sphingobacterium faecale]